MRISVSLLPVLAFVLAGCNTMAGVGQDMQNAGASVAYEAKKAEAKL